MPIGGGSFGGSGFGGDPSLLDVFDGPWTYDFYTDIINLTGISDLTDDLMNWAIDEAITIYIGDDPSEYDDTISNVDNRLIAMLAAAFILANKTGSSFNVAFTNDVSVVKLDEFSVENRSSGDTFDAASQQVTRAFKQFFNWLNYYLNRGIVLQYKDISTSIVVAAYDKTLYAVDRTTPQGL